MPAKPLEFEVIGPVENISTYLNSELHAREQTARRQERVYYDSFDWRLHNAGCRLMLLSEDGEKRLYWDNGLNGGALGFLLVDEMPRFAWDFPPGPWRAQLEKLLSMRALLSLCRISSATQEWRILKGADKTVLRLYLEQNTLLKTRSRAKLPTILKMQELRGYHKNAREIEETLHSQAALKPLNRSLFDSALQSLKKQPGDYSSKLRLELSENWSAGKATRVILRELLNTMRANESGLKKDLDSEFLHDFRVAVRRSRSALSQIKGVFPPEQIAPFRAGFAELGALTSPTRDLDVYLLKYDSYKNALPPDSREALQALYVFLQKRQQQEHKKLSAYLNSPTYKEFVRAWRRFLDTPDKSAPHAEQPVRETADKRIWRVYRRVLKEGCAISPESPNDDLHELRKSCKKLRYLMEFFQSLYDNKKIARLIKILKGLQENLGDFQDYEVQIEQLTHFAQEMQEEGSAPPDTLLAMGRLTAGLDAGQQRCREEFGARFAEFISHQNEFAALFSQTEKEDAP